MQGLWNRAEIGKKKPGEIIDLSETLKLGAWLHKDAVVTYLKNHLSRTAE